MKKGFLSVVAISAAIILVDQLTKIWALNSLSEQTSFSGSRFQLILTFNSGSMLGLGGGVWWGLVVAVVAAVIIFVIWHFFLPTSNIVVIVGAGLMVGGSLGNLIDRAVRNSYSFLGGDVVDFIYFSTFSSASTGFVFNVADVAFTIGAAIMIRVSLSYKREAKVVADSPKK